MSGWAWFATIWFGTWAAFFVFGLASTVVRARWGLSDQVEDQIKKAVTQGIDEWMAPDPREEDDVPGRGDVLPLDFKDIDGLSEQL